MDNDPKDNHSKLFFFILLSASPHAVQSMFSLQEPTNAIMCVLEGSEGEVETKRRLYPNETTNGVDTMYVTSSCPGDSRREQQEHVSSSKHRVRLET